MIWGSVEAMLWAPTEIRLRQGIRLFQSMQLCVLLTLFPDQLKTHRSSRTLELLLATLMSIQGLLQLILHRDKQWANRIIHLMVGPLRQVVVIGTTGRPAIQQCVDFLRTGIEGRGFEDEASVYCLFSSNTLYIGKALLNRAHGKLGIASRIMEHMTSILRKNSATSRTIRAILLRRCPLCTICFLPVKRGRRDWIKASETVAIRTLRPQGRRPPPRFRQPSSQGLWGSHDCLRQICMEARKIKTTGNLCGPCRPSSKLTERNSRAFLQKQESLVVCRCMLHEMEASWRYGPVSLDRSSTFGNFFEVFHLNVQW